MRVLILGSRGMLGRALVRAFAGDDVTGWDVDDLDITDAIAVSEKLHGVSADVVINAAAYTDVERAEREPDVAMRVNGTAIGDLAAVTRELQIPLLHVSTDYVFSGDDHNGYTEEAIPVNPLSAYGRSKLHGEELLKNSGSAFWLVRTAWLYGPGGKNFVETMIRIGRERPDVRVVSDQHMSPTYTRDLAEAIVSLVRDRAPAGVYHLTNRGVTTCAEFARAIFEFARLPVTVIPITLAEYPSAAKRPPWSILKNTKRPLLRDWREALHEYLKIREPVTP